MVGKRQPVSLGGGRGKGLPVLAIFRVLALGGQIIPFTVEVAARHSSMLVDLMM